MTTTAPKGTTKSLLAPKLRSLLAPKLSTCLLIVNNFLQSVIQQYWLPKQNKTKQKALATSPPNFFWFYLVTSNYSKMLMGNVME